MNHFTKTRSSKPGARESGRSGFTLLEISLSLALLMILIGGIYKVAAASFQVSGKVTEKGQREMHVAAFFDLLRQNFGSMPGNGKLTMAITEGVGATYSSEIVLADFPLAFSWGGVAAGSEKVLIVSEKDPLGGTQVRIRYLNEEAAESHESGSLARDEGQGLTLISGIKSMYWRFFDHQEEEWIEEWEEENRRPSLVELNVEFFSLAEPIRAVFWIPVVKNPETFVAGAMRPRGARGGNRAVQQPGGGRPRPGEGAGPQGRAGGPQGRAGGPQGRAGGSQGRAGSPAGRGGGSQGRGGGSQGRGGGGPPRGGR